MIKKLKVKSQKSKVKFRFFLLLFILLMMPVVIVNGQSITSTTSSPTIIAPTDSQEDKEIQSLKDKIATKVAELREKNGKAVSGIVQEVNLQKDNLKIKTWKDEEFAVEIDPDLTKFYQISGTQKTEVKSNTIKKDSFIIVTGIIKENSIEANFIYLDELFIVGSGKITEVDKQNYFLRVITLDKENYTLDVETFTKREILNIKTLVVENVGFSKIKEGDTIHFVVKKTTSNVAGAGEEKELNRFAAQKILIIPQEYFIK